MTDSQPVTTPEQAVLGSAILRPSAYSEASMILTDADFDAPQDRAVWEAMGRLTSRGKTIDTVLLLDEVGGSKQPLSDYLVTLANAVPHAENVRYYVDLVAKRSALRQLRLLASSLPSAAENEPDIAQRDLLTAQRLISQIQRGRHKPGVDMSDITGPTRSEFEERVRSANDKGHRLIGVSTQIASLDDIICGMRPGSLNIVAARTGLGKTAYACQVALLGATKSDVPALYFSLEMTPMELAERFFSRLSEVNSEKLRKGDIGLDEWKRITNAGAILSKRGMLTISNSNMIGQILSEARAFRVTNRDRTILVVVDYLQLVRTGERGRSREQEVAEVSSALKALAVEIEAPVLAPVQFNRSPEFEDREPRLSDIRESGAIENDADLVVFIQRKREQADGLCTMRVAKNRNGPLGEAHVRWQGATYQLSDADDGYRPREGEWS